MIAQYDESESINDLINNLPVDYQPAIRASMEREEKKIDRVLNYARFILNH